MDKKYDLGIVTPVHITQERHDIALAWIYSMLQIKVPKGFKIKHVIFNDHSPAPDPIYEYQNRAEYNIHIYTPSELQGKWNLGNNFREALTYMHDCKYVISIPDDMLLNPYLFEIIDYDLQDASIWEHADAITYFRDTRGNIWGNDISGKDLDIDHYNVAPCCDGFLLLAKYETYKNMMGWINPAEAESKGSTLVWRNCNKYLREGVILQYEQSLAQHIGNPFSSMVGAPRNKERYIYGENVNLFEKPEVLK